MTDSSPEQADGSASADPDRLLATCVDAIITRFEAVNAVRDHAVGTGRQIVRLAANSVRALHREDHADARALLAQAAGLLAEVQAATAAYPAIALAGYVQDAAKEYAEAAITAALLDDRPIPGPEVLAVQDAAWLNGLAEAGSELRRDVLDRLRADRTSDAERLLARMDAIYAVLVAVDFPDAITGGLRRTTDQFRAVLERTRGDVTLSVRQQRLERALASHELSMSSEGNG
ncbi:MAG: haloacid dehalogenase [Thermomicrobiales bacterium]